MQVRSLMIGLVLGLTLWQSAAATPGEAARRLDTAQHYENQGWWLDALGERLWFDEELTSLVGRSDNHHRIWALLRRLTPAQRSRVRQGLPASALGWWELARIDALYHDDPWRYAQTLQQWEARHPGHPASESVLLTIRSTLPVVHTQGYDRRTVPLRAARRIALVLPLATAAGRAVRDGFVEAAGAAGAAVEVFLFDSSATRPLDSHARASQYGVDLIVGPLDKDSVDQLNRSPGLATPTLALNYARQQSAWAPQQLFQFGLAPEDEAATAAGRALADGVRRVAILASNDTWGQRGASAFANTFAARGGIVVDDARYTIDSDLQQTVKSFLRVGQAQPLWQDARASKPANTPASVGHQQVDAVFLMARANTARQIRPLLRFYRAVDLPVYATGAIYEPKADTERDHDLRGVVFCDSVPLSVDRARDSGTSLPRLRAFGADAFALSQALPELLQSPNRGIAGATGALQLDSLRAIRRTPDCHRVAVGNLVPVS